MLSPKEGRGTRDRNSDPSNLSMGTVDPDRDRDVDVTSEDGINGGSGNVRTRLLKDFANNGDNNNNGSNPYSDPDEYDPEVKPDVEEIKRNAYIARIYRNNCFFTPGWILALFTLVNTFTYYDRGSISASATYIATDRSITGGNATLSQAETGALYSVFMVGYFVFSPICVGMGTYFTSKAIIVFGIACWCGAVVLAGVSNSYPLLMFARGLTGIGEAAYSGFTVTMVDNVCPKESRTKWIGIFFSTIPFGTALGIALNGQICGIDFGFTSGWRMGFFIELIPMIILLIIIIFLPAEFNTRLEDRGEAEMQATKDDEERAKKLVKRYHTEHGADEDSSDDEEDKAPEEEEAESAGTHVPLWQAVKLLMCNVNFLLLSFGYGAYTFVLGAISFFAIAMLTEGPMNVSEGVASILLGASTAILGLIGAIVGGYLVDKWGGSKGWEGVYKCALLLAGCMIISVPCGFVLLSIDNFVIFVCLFVFSVWWLFLVTAPVNTALLTVVPANLRPYSVALSVMLMHLFGDFPSTPLTGAIADAYDGGCSDFDSDKDGCLAHNVTVPGRCKFIPRPSPRENSRCVNEQELTIALRFAWCFMVLAIPLWGAVAYRVKKHKNVFGHEIEHHHHHHHHHEDQKDGEGSNRNNRNSVPDAVRYAE